jgi:hypothetical protein
MDMNRPPSMFATPRATSSLFADTVTFVIPSGSSSTVPSALTTFFVLPVLVPSDFAATLDSKNPSRAIKKEVEKASSTWWKFSESKGKCAWNGAPLALILPRMSRPCLCQSKFQVKTADKTTTTKRSGM